MFRLSRLMVLVTMIALAGCMRLQALQKNDLAIDAYSRWSLEDLATI